MKKQELIRVLLNFETISYDNGKYNDNFHLGQIIAHFIENEIGSKYFQKLQEVLSDSITYSGYRSLNRLYDQGAFSEYKLIKRLDSEIQFNFKEILVIDEFKSIISHKEFELNQSISKKERLVKTYLRKLFVEIVEKSPKIKSLINFEDALNYLEEKILNPLDLRSLTEHELNNFQLDKADKHILIKQIGNNLSYYIKQINP